MLVLFSPERGPGSKGLSQDRLQRGVAALPAVGSAGGPAHLEALAGCWLWGGNICPGALSTASLSRVLVITLGGAWWQEGLPVRATASWAAQPHPVAGVSSWSLGQVRWCDLAVWEMWSGEGTRVFG